MCEARDSLQSRGRYTACYSVALSMNSIYTQVTDFIFLGIVSEIFPNYPIYRINGLSLARTLSLSSFKINLQQMMTWTDSTTFIAGPFSRHRWEVVLQTFQVTIICRHLLPTHPQANPMWQWKMQRRYSTFSGIVSNIFHSLCYLKMRQRPRWQWTVLFYSWRYWMSVHRESLLYNNEPMKGSAESSVRELFSRGRRILTTFEACWYTLPGKTLW